MNKKHSLNKEINDIIIDFVVADMLDITIDELNELELRFAYEFIGYTKGKFFAEETNAKQKSKE